VTRLRAATALVFRSDVALCHELVHALDMSSGTIDFDVQWGSARTAAWMLTTTSRGLKSTHISRFRT
jgi:hypothetical protein